MEEQIEAPSSNRTTSVPVIANKTWTKHGISSRETSDDIAIPNRHAQAGSLAIYVRREIFTKCDPKSCWTSVEILKSQFLISFPFSLLLLFSSFPFFLIVCGRGGGDCPRLPLLKRGLALYLRRDVFFLISIDNLGPKAAMVSLYIS